MRQWFARITEEIVCNVNVRKIFAGGMVAAGMALVSPAQASLTTSYSVSGDVAVATGGCGSTSQACSFTESVPTGSTVVQAYLYSSLFSESASGPVPGGTLNGNAVSYTTALGVNAVAGLQAYRSDVTSLVAGIVGGGSASPFAFNVTETLGNQDGEGLVIVYQNAAVTTTSSVGILDGFSASTGDSASINFANPLEPSTTPGFQANMSIGDGFSFDGKPCGSSASQFSDISVATNSTASTLMTDGAGCNDNSVDTTPADGNLITVGNINAACPGNLATGNEATDIANDHENYCLNSYIHDGDTTITTSTLNPSHDDNIFLEVFDVTGTAGFNAPPPPPTDTPEPASLTILGVSLIGLGMARRRRRS